MVLPNIAATRIILTGDFTVKAGWTLGPRKLGDYELVYFPVGSGTQYRTDDRTYTLDDPCFVLTRPGEEHAYLFDSAMPTRHLFVHFTFDPSDACNHLASLVSLGGRSVVSAGYVPVLPGLLKHILHTAAVKSAHWEERCHLALHMLLAELSSLPETSDLPSTGLNLPLQITRALHYIDDHLHLPLSVAEVARKQGWTHEHFSRTFIKLLGISPQKAIAQRRIERACQLLVQTDSTIKQIAYCVGFCDEHYFYRSFFKLKGITAAQYRRQFSDPRAHHLAPTEDYRALYPLNRYFVFP